MKSLTKVIAGTTGLSAFGVAVAAGLGAGNSASDVLLRALVATAVCYLLGLVVGAIGERTLNEYVKSYFAARAVPSASVGESSGDNSQGTVEKSVGAQTAG